MQVFIRQALAASLGLAAAHAGAQSSVSISGTVDVSVRQVRNQGLGTVTSQASGTNSTSKLVLRGQEDLGDGLSAGFYLDGSLLADTGAMGASGPFWDRRSTVSLASRQWGELRLGRDWVPTHLVWSGFDPFATLGIGSANGFRSFTASRALGLEPEQRFELAAFAHTFTHYRLHIRPWLVPVRATGLRESARPERWVPADELPSMALPAPVTARTLTVEIDDAANPARFYFVSYPAHASHPSKRVRRDEARTIQAGEATTANRRVIRQSIRPGIVDTCQLVMGFTELADGNVWNTMPPHTHRRRSEIYMYFDTDPGRVMHLMGEPSEPRAVFMD